MRDTFEKPTVLTTLIFFQMKLILALDDKAGVREIVSVSFLTSENVLSYLVGYFVCVGRVWSLVYLSDNSLNYLFTDLRTSRFVVERSRYIPSSWYIGGDNWQHYRSITNYEHKTRYGTSQRR